MPIFRVKSGKNYTGQIFFTQAPLVVLVTNMRYDYTIIDWRHGLQRYVPEYSISVLDVGGGVISRQILAAEQKLSCETNLGFIFSFDVGHW